MIGGRRRSLNPTVLSIFAHRGGAKLAPENTMPAIDNGMALGADGLEIDVQLSADGIPVVIHDQTLDRTTDRTGPVSSLTAAELARVDAGFAFEIDGGHPFRGQGIGVPRLDDVLRQHRERAHHHRDEGRPAGARARGWRFDQARRTPSSACASDRSTRNRSIRSAPKHPEVIDQRVAGEARWSLHRSWVRWPWISARPYVAFQVPEYAGRMRVVSRGVRPARPPPRPRAAGVGRQRTRRHPSLVGLGR